MDHRTAVGFSQSLYSPSPASDSDHAVEQRLARLLELNDELARERSLYRNSRERLEALMMRLPIDARTAYSYFGLMIGTLPPASIALKLVFETASIRPSVALFLLALLASVTTGVVGFQLGKFVPHLLAGVDHLRFPNRVAAVSLIGLGWGAVSGAAGGLFLLVIGAFFAAVFGAVVGAVTVPVFVLLHRMLRRGDMIELKHFLPVSLAIALSLCAFIFGL